jgi:hypothetical protein
MLAAVAVVVMVAVGQQFKRLVELVAEALVALVQIYHQLLAQQTLAVVVVAAATETTLLLERNKLVVRAVQVLLLFVTLELNAGQAAR